MNVLAIYRTIWEMPRETTMPCRVVCGSRQTKTAVARSQAVPGRQGLHTTVRADRPVVGTGERALRSAAQMQQQLVFVRRASKFPIASYVRY